MKLKTWYQLSLFLPLLPAGVVFALDYWHISVHILLFIYSLGAFAYIPYIFIVLAWWNIGRYSSDEMAKSIWFIPIPFVFFSPASIYCIIQWSNLLQDPYNFYSGLINNYPLTLMLSFPFSLICGYANVILVYALTETLKNRFALVV
jgi:hypothetical protein